MASIFELVTAANIVAYWTEVASNEISYLGEELWPSVQKLGLDLKWIKGSHGLPVALKPSAYDVKAKKRDRIGFKMLHAQMPFFKESTYIDEELRQQLNMVKDSGNVTLIDSITNHVFRDEVDLLRGAAATRERIRMMALTTGAVSITANGQNYDYDYDMPANHKVDVTTETGMGGKAWTDEEATIIDDVRFMQDRVEDETGVRPSRAVCSRKTFGYLRKNKEIRQAIHGSDSTAPVSDTKIINYLKDELDLVVVVYSKKIINEKDVEMALIPDDLFVMMPDGDLGTGWFGTTPEQSDLMSGSAANVAITDVGVAVTTTKQTDPVNVETKVSMIFLPSFEAVDNVALLDVA